MWMMWTSFLLAAVAAVGTTQSEYDVVIQNGTVVDGSGAARFAADVALSGDRIVRVVRIDRNGRNGISGDNAALVLDADGLIVAPGFIDQHAHVQLSIREHPIAENFLRQGITTLVASLHSGDHPILSTSTWPPSRLRPTSASSRATRGHGRRSWASTTVHRRRKSSSA